MNRKVRWLCFLLCAGSTCVALATLVTMKWVQQEVADCFGDQCPTQDQEWFTQRLNKSVQPFLSEHCVSEDTFHWWKNLQNGIKNFTLFNQTVEELFKMFPQSPDLTGSSPDQYRTCAVVGNSGNLKGSHYGPLIDFHDIVIRMNKGQTKGYEADVGTRTTHHVLYPESAPDLDNATHLVLFPFKMMDLEWLLKTFTTGFSGKSYMPVKEKIKANKDLVMVINPAFMRYVHETWLEKKGRYASTGFMALVLALHVCDEVRVFGFGADQDGNWSHYFEKLADKRLKTGVHPGGHEYAIIQKLAQQRRVDFYKGL